MWLTEFRQKHGLSIEQLGAYIRHRGRKLDPPLRVSDTLLERLETEDRFRTVPKLANLIADSCGASAAQRDALVLKRYRGTWKPTHRDFRPPKALASAPEAPRARANRGADASRRAVVQLDPAGRVMARFVSITNAAAVTCTSKELVSGRCRHRFHGNEFRQLPFTFRFADEWDALTEEQRRALMPG